MAFVSIARRTFLALAGLALLATAAPAPADPLAKNLFSSRELPAATEVQVHGFYSKGCFSGGVALATDGPRWQAMRLSRNRRWGHPDMVELVARLSQDAAANGWPGLLVGDISQPRGGPMPSDHSSHQAGLDADIWFRPMPDRRLSYRERERLNFVSMLKQDSLYVDDRKWTPAHAMLLKQAASYPEVERIFVHPGIKKKLCDTVSGDRSWLNKVRPLWGHHSHFHIRIGCPEGSPGCRSQRGTGTGDGCDESLAWWFTDEPWEPSPGPAKPRARDVMTMDDLPNACRAVLQAPAPASEQAVTFHGDGRFIAAGASAPVPATAYAPTPAADIPLPLPRPFN